MPQKDIETIFKTGAELGLDALTMTELHTLKTQITKRIRKLKDAPAYPPEFYQRVIEIDILPIAKRLFPETIKTSKNLTAKTLTRLFKEKANTKEKNEHLKPTKTERQDIISLTQMWRKNFTYVKYRGEKVNSTPAQDGGILFRALGSKRKSRGTTPYWPALEFTTKG